MKIDYGKIAKEARKTVLRLIYKAQTSHIGSCFSAIDIMAVLFEKVNINKDEVVLSAGWKAAAWYYFLWRKGVITEKELNSFCMPNSPFIGLVEPMGRWGLRIGGGSMGLGLPGAVGLALAKQLKGEDGKVYTLLSDGECQIGTFYESLLIAKQCNLSNLIVLIDNNFYQAMGETKNILNIEPLKEKFLSCGWQVYQIDGHNYEQIENALNYPQNDHPYVIICDTIKGRGVSKFEGNNLYHYKAPSKEEYLEALNELNNAI